MKFSEVAEDVLIAYKRGEITKVNAIKLLVSHIRESIGEEEKTLQGFPSQWKGDDADRMKKLWVNARNHLRRQLKAKL